MAKYTYGAAGFAATTFTSPLAGSDDEITANDSQNFTINGNGGNDVVSTGSGNDTITTGSGNDTITAGDGNNTVTAGEGTNAVTSGLGNDTITTGSGDDTITAGDGNNTVTAGDGANAVTSGLGNDTITSGAGKDVINSGAGDDIISAGAGDDIVNSGGGNDIVNAGAGNDVVNSGGGTDSLVGAGGHDTFVYGSLAEAQLGADTIADFSTSDPWQAGEGDSLDLRGLVSDFTDMEGGSLAQLVASGHLDFSAGAGGTVISFDSNGSAAGGTIGVLANLVGVGFGTEAGSVLTFGDNLLV